ncbi:osmotically-inducible protein OsmY [Dyadobacter jejuensis]|uniref:Osmotically-inducible protein OsmY n=1 Tax=Dyadobacter jejuensis TaxID=1082580 RepID=A0A316AMQ5_9BACT|nr:BON domain-containing protein [Dyadobacter jejuensis]PWJ59055.1 osmotically-inducible protein OsmY [Dyadobacter jejuensis]
MKTLFEIRAEIMQQIWDHESLGEITERVKVVLDGKLVLITGQFKNYEQKRMLLDIVSGYPQMQILCDATVEMDMRESEADSRLKEIVMQALKDGQGDYHKVRLRVSEGRVFLDGMVRSSKDRKIIQDQIDQIPGVRSIFNNLTFPCESVRMSAAS